MYSLAISGLATNQPTDVKPLLRHPASRLVTGLHKLASQAIFLLLTEQGSVAGLRGYGVNVVARLGGISLLETRAIDNIVSELSSQLADQLRRLTLNKPDSERLKSLSVKAIRVENSDLLYVELELESAAGEQAIYDLSLFKSNLENIVG